MRTSLQSIYKKAACKGVLLGALALGGCGTYGPVPGEGSGSVPMGTYVGQPTGVCVIEGDFVNAFFDSNLKEVGRNITPYLAYGKCGTRAKPLGRCFHEMVTRSYRVYTDGIYRGDAPLRYGSVRIQCPWNVEFYPPGGGYFFRDVAPF